MAFDGHLQSGRLVRGARLSIEAKPGAELAQALENLPGNLEAEQALIGIVLFDNEAYKLLPSRLEPAAFKSEFFGRLWSSIGQTLDDGYTTDPILLSEEFRWDPAYVELGGLRYLAELIDKAPAVSNAAHYARIIADLYIRRRLVNLAAQAATSAVYEPSRSSIEIVRSMERELLELQIKDRRDHVATIQDAIDGTLDYVDDTSKTVGVGSGLPALDKGIGPMVAGDLIVLGGATGAGKSALAIRICMGVAAPDLMADIESIPPEKGVSAKGVLELHGEMTFGERSASGAAVRRHMADVGYHMFGERFPTYAQIKAKKLQPGQREMLQSVRALFAQVPIFGAKVNGLTLGRLRTLIERQLLHWEKAGIEPGLVSVDHIGLMCPEDRIMGRYEAQTQIIIGLKELAGELGIPILALAQLSRGIKARDDKRPQIDDLKDSGEIENSADAVLLAYREAYYAIREKPPNQDREFAEWVIWEERTKSKKLELILGKVREGAAGVTCEFWADVAYNAIRIAEPRGAVGFL